MPDFDSKSVIYGTFVEDINFDKSNDPNKNTFEERFLQESSVSNTTETIQNDEIEADHNPPSIEESFNITYVTSMTEQEEGESMVQIMEKETGNVTEIVQNEEGETIDHESGASNNTERVEHEGEITIEQESNISNIKVAIQNELGLADEITPQIEEISQESTVSTITDLLENEEVEAIEHVPSIAEALQAEYFQLKLFWQEGYFWQEETRERRWCAECEGLCEAGRRVLIQVCDNENEKQRWIFTNNKMSPHIAKNLCMTFSNRRDIILSSCNSRRNARQAFDVIRQYHGKVRDAYEFIVKGRCLTQHHHPKSNEVVFLQNCVKARRSNTSIWHFGGPWNGHS